MSLARPSIFYDVIILGAGAAGLMCAGIAARRGRSVLVLEQARHPGEKIRISGGGRCNFTNLHTSPANFLSDNPRFCHSALNGYTQYDFIALVETYGIAWHEKTRGQLFCDGSSRQIIDLLRQECRSAQLRLGVRVSAIAKGEEGFVVTTDQGEFRGGSLVVATGGPSIPKMGASGFGYRIAEQFNLKIVPPRAALVPLTFDANLLGKFRDLSGVSVDCVVSCGKTRFDEALLFTHRGLSGPAILQISSYWRAGEDIVIDMAPERDVLAMLKQLRRDHPRQELATALAGLLPKRLAQTVADMIGGPDRLADFSDKLLSRVTAALKAWHVRPNGTEGYRTAEVTLGGVDTTELSSKTFESKSVPGLYFIGEVVDVTGHLGGFNFQWAWSSGHAAGRHV
ncbi:NAD(P)/FAD-dependent oxidoreductase [Bradyrhizobium sp.]|jgi:predicted Rossmann fold flavoprotein|uniref:NAD(P)/FAD-dependent oxidoreductase n=1 Tax=Bradyrhizobium sp. TaxID=376 RepID=UPI002E0ABE7A|nr:NAD(P)/FAD-dependent oxidoreductase [Bradyrhizobium sp.]